MNYRSSWPIISEINVTNSIVQRSTNRWAILLTSSIQNSRHISSFLFSFTTSTVYSFSSGGRLKDHNARMYLLQIVDAVTYLHEQIGILHRDLKPGNVLLSNNDQVILISIYHFVSCWFEIFFLTFTSTFCDNLIQLSIIHWWTDCLRELLNGSENLPVLKFRFFLGSWSQLLNCKPTYPSPSSLPNEICCLSKV